MNAIYTLISLETYNSIQTTTTRETLSPLPLLPDTFQLFAEIFPLLRHYYLIFLCGTRYSLCFRIL